MLTGRQALSSIDQTVMQVRGELQQTENQVEAAREKIVEIRKTQADLFKSLARIRLDSLVSGKLVDGLDTADHRVAELLRERVQSLNELQQQTEVGRKELERLEQERSVLAEALDDAAATLDRGEAEVQRKLAVDDAYQAQLEKAQKAGRTAEYAEEKTQRAEQDRQEKGEPYDNDPLFSYLWNRKYGTSEYSASFLTRYLDKWVARLCDYHDARPNYHMLLEIPARLREHADRVRADADAEYEALTELETRASEAGGLPALQTAVDQAEQNLQQADQAIGEQEQLIHELLQKRSNFAAGDDEFSQESMRAMVDTFKRENVEALYRYARATPTNEDDMMVRQVADASRDIEELNEAIKEYKRVHERNLDRLKELEQLRQKFKRERFDDLHTGFNNGDMLTAVLGQFMRGMATSGDLWRTLERGRRYRRIEADPGFGSGGFARPGGGWRMPFPPNRGGFPPGGLGGPGRSGGFGGFGGRGGGGLGGGLGGGFKTGGGF